jgi:hypothetical protein
MASVNGRLRRLEGRIKPPYEIPPEFHLSTRVLLKAQDAYRRELDGLEPDPANELTDEERAHERAGLPAWLAYLEEERDRSPPDDPMRDFMTAAIDSTRAEMAEDHDRPGGNE